MARLNCCGIGPNIRDVATGSPDVPPVCDSLHMRSCPALFGGSLSASSWTVRPGANSLKCAGRHHIVAEAAIEVCPCLLDF